MDSLPSRIMLVHAESARLTHYLGTLSPAAWHHPSACAGWEVGDVVAHLTRGAEAYLEWITRGLQGETTPRRGAPEAGTGEGAASAARRAQRALDVRARLGDQLFTAFQARVDEFNALASGLSPKTFGCGDSSLQWREETAVPLKVASNTPYVVQYTYGNSQTYNWLCLSDSLPYRVAPRVPQRRLAVPHQRDAREPSAYDCTPAWYGSTCC
jgi:hypothetical protein